MIARVALPDNFHILSPFCNAQANLNKRELRIMQGVVTRLVK